MQSPPETYLAYWLLLKFSNCQLKRLRTRRGMMSGVYIHMHRVRRRLNRRRRWYFRRRHRVSTEHVLVRALVRVLMNAFGVRKDSSFVALSCFVKIRQSKGLDVLLYSDVRLCVFYYVINSMIQKR